LSGPGQALSEHLLPAGRLVNALRIHEGFAGTYFKTGVQWLFPWDTMASTPPTEPWMKKLLPSICLICVMSMNAHAQKVGEVDTVFKLLGPDHKIVVEAYDDPKVKGVSCYVARARTGGIKGAIGLAEDKADASIACRQVGPISFNGPMKQQEEVFTERLSILFKRLRVVRMVDPARNVLIYLSYSDKLIEGSPKNSVTVVPVDKGTAIPIK
jgi:CreA protein